MAERGLVIDYRYPEGSDTRLDTPVVATITLGLMSLILGLFTLDDRYGFLDIGRDSVSMILYILSGLLLIMATRTLRNRIITESMYFILAAFSCIMYTLTSVQTDSEMIYSMILFALGFIACTFIFNSRKENLFAVMSAAFAVVIIVGAVMSSFAGIVADILLVANGIGLLTVGGLTLTGYRTHVPLLPSNAMEMEDEEYPEILVSTAGVLLFAIMSFSVGINMMGETGLLISTIMFKLVMASIVLAIGLYALYHGIAGEGMTMTLVALSSLIYAVSMIMFEHVPHYLDIIFGALLMPVALSMLREKEVLIGMTALLLSGVMLLEVFWEGTHQIEYMIITAKVVATGFALLTWYRYDTGSEPRFMLFLESKLRRREE